MGWASRHIADLKAGKTVQFRPHGNSMQGKVESGQLCTVEPYGSDENIKVKDIVLCNVKGKQYLHLVTALRDDRGGVAYQISNNKKHVNGWVRAKSIFGKCTKVED